MCLYMGNSIYLFFIKIAIQPNPNQSTDSMLLLLKLQWSFQRNENNHKILVNHKSP